MRIALCVAIFCLSTLFSSAAQAPVARDPQAIQILQRSLMALSPDIAVQDITLSGSVRYIAGSDDETGTAALKATALGDAGIDLSLPSGNRSEVYNLRSGPPVGQWPARDTTRKEIPFHNLVGEPAWFSPVTTISRRLNGGPFAVSYVGAETFDSQSVHHVAVSQPPPPTANDFNLFQHLTQIDLYVDPSTFLPVALSFNIHPDANELVDIPVEIRHSDYRRVNGQQIPFHIQKSLNNSLLLDIQLDSAIVNTGLPSTTFGVS